jgi:branched-chain amino acid transport system permease protein
MALLEIEDVSIAFGGVRALSSVSMTIDQGAIVALIGPNGAGKSTLFNCITGIYRPDAGRIRFDGTPIVKQKPSRVAALGVARTFQNIELFSMMSTLDNVLLGRHLHMKTGPLGAMWFGERTKRAEVDARRKVEEVLDFLDLQFARHELVMHLPYGVKKKVELARALALEPKLLLLDEPSAGMTSEEKEEMVFTVRDLRRELGITVALVEHDLAWWCSTTERRSRRVIRSPSPRTRPWSGRTWGTTDVLVCERLEVFYNRYVQVLRGVSVGVEAGQIAAVLGPNGAGKSTLIRTIMGLIDDQPERGEILLDGKAIDRLDTGARVARGLACVPEGREVFRELDVRENLVMGAWTMPRNSIDDRLERVFGHFPRLRERASQDAGTLSGGEQQMLAIGRALMSAPKVLLLDEPSLGLAPIVAKEIFAILEALAAEGIALLLVEQNAKRALELASVGYVLEGGRIVHSGPADELLEDDDVREFYLGQRASESKKGYARYKRRRRWA